MTPGVGTARADLEELSRTTDDKLTTATEAVRRLVPNDAVIGVPGLTRLFYLNNHGDARVTVERAMD